METIAREIEQKHPSVSSIEKLKPIEFIDDDGCQRELFTFKTKNEKEVDVIFYTREELPFSKKITEGKAGVIYGSPPQHRDISEWNNFINDITQSNNETNHLDPQKPMFSMLSEVISENKAIFFVENTPVHLLDLAFSLGVESPQLREARKKAAVDNIYTPEVYNLLDDAIAGTVVDNLGNLKKRTDNKGEALAILALMGDQNARHELDIKRAVIDNLDNQQKLEQQKFFEQLVNKDLENVDLTNFGAYHVTKYKPKFTPEGVAIRTAFDATHGNITRDTIHFSLLGPISDSFGSGGWENMDYLIEGNLNKIKDKNGNPIMINPIDTYFLLNPGEPLIIPDAHVTMPGYLPKGIYRQDQDQITYYKKNLLAPDIDNLFKDRFDKLFETETQAVFKQFENILHKSIWTDKFSLLASYGSKKFDEYSKKYNAQIGSLNFNVFFNQLRSEGVKETVTKLVHNSNLLEEEDVNNIQKSIMGWLATKARDNCMINNTTYAAQHSSNQYISAMKLASEWKVPGSTRSQVHSEDGDSGSNLTEKTLAFFTEIKKAQEKRSKLVLDENGKGPDSWFVPWPNQLWIENLDKPIDITSRTSIMKGFRTNRLDLNDFPHFMLPQHRRMMYISGEI